MKDLTTAMSDLPRDLEEEVLSRVLLASLRAVRTTCKKWNRRLSKYRFTKKYIRKSRSATADKEFLAIMMLDSSLYLINVVIDKIDNENNVESSIERKSKLISVNDADGVDIISVVHYNALLLCLTEEKTPRLVVWNPCHGQSRWIETAYRCGLLE